MALDAFPSRSNIPESSEVFIRLLGANGADPTEEEGTAGLNVTRTGEGAYRITFTENPGTFCGANFGFGAATPGDLKGYTAVVDTPALDSTGLLLDFVVYDSTFTAADIIAAQYCYVFLKFKRTGVSG